MEEEEGRCLNTGQLRFARIVLHLLWLKEETLPELMNNEPVHDGTVYGLSNQLSEAIHEIAGSYNVVREVILDYVSELEDLLACLAGDKGSAAHNALCSIRIALGERVDNPEVEEE
jgi:hypothetical protein